jgi:hypothetical protein
MTLDIYADLFDDDLDGVAARLDAAAADVPRMRPTAAVVPLLNAHLAADLRV